MDVDDVFLEGWKLGLLEVPRTPSAMKIRCLYVIGFPVAAVVA